MSCRPARRDKLEEAPALLVDPRDEDTAILQADGSLVATYARTTIPRLVSALDGVADLFTR